MFASGIVPDFNRELVREKTKIVDVSRYPYNFPNSLSL